MLRPIRKVRKRKNRYSVNSQNLLYTIFCESTVYLSSYANSEAHSRKAFHITVIDELRRSLAEHLHVQDVEGLGDAFRPRKSCSDLLS